MIQAHLAMPLVDLAERFTPPRMVSYALALYADAKGSLRQALPTPSLCHSSSLEACRSLLLSPLSLPFFYFSPFPLSKCLHKLTLHGIFVYTFHAICEAHPHAKDHKTYHPSAKYISIIVVVVWFLFCFYFVHHFQLKIII